MARSEQLELLLVAADVEIYRLNTKIKQLEKNTFAAERVEANLNKRIAELEQQLKGTKA